MLNLMWLFITPLISAVVLFSVPMVSQRYLKYLAIILSFFPLAYLLYGNGSWQGQHVNYPWIPALSIRFHLNVDSLSLLFLYLTAITVPISLFSIQEGLLPFPRTFYGLVLLLEAFLIVFFTARDLAVFTIFWEAMLIPLYLIITFWGGEKRRSAAIKFIIYMIAGSVLMVVAVLSLYMNSNATNGGETFDLDRLLSAETSLPHAKWILGIFLLAFAVKTPLFPFHAWLPDAYCQAPTAGTILLSAVLSKAGIYGILRIGFELFPNLLREWSPWLMPFAISGVFYGGLCAWRQRDYKRLIAYSSFSHVNFILVGLFIWNQTAHAGAILQAMNHGITIAALFLVAGWLEERVGTTSMRTASGLCKYLPHLCWLTLFFVLSAIALPGTGNFIGELMILFGLFQQNSLVAATLGLTVILSVIYMLRWMQQVFFGHPSHFQKILRDIGIKEILIALPLVALILWIGIYPNPIIEQIKQFVTMDQTIKNR